MYIYVCVEFVYILCRRESCTYMNRGPYVCTKDSRPAKEQDFYRRPRIHFRGKTKFRWVVGIGRVLSYFIIHEGTFLPAADSLARSFASDAEDGVCESLSGATSFDQFLSRPTANMRFTPKFFTDRQRFLVDDFLGFYSLSLSLSLSLSTILILQCTCKRISEGIKKRKSLVHTTKNIPMHDFDILTSTVVTIPARISIYRFVRQMTIGKHVNDIYS